ncbi:O-antigen ligase family protein [Flavobacterium silvaticum]|uniref:O-antigen ligase-related domain-containing protein n=1 Tax=Flavobacterium silvaticum TaxID=1852020 RepID=A0A972FLU7_9FLAO|nr:O-antigen ligase family protein [Flavobacterium silvaticum]NMH28381.1 hypothetical protein [Flavobacterium silvaticum]
MSKELMLIVVPVCFMLLPVFPKEQTTKILRYFSYAMIVYAVSYLIRAVARFAISHDSSVFFYHELVTLEVNAIHVSVYFALALCWFLSAPGINHTRIFCAALLGGMIVLLSSKIMLTVTAILVIWHLFSARQIWNRKAALILGTVILFGGILLSGKIIQRFSEEFLTVTNENTLNTKPSSQGHVFNKSISEAWNTEQFTPNDYFPGTAFRVYQVRIFTEMLSQDAIFWNGYGLNASYDKIAQKAVEHHLYSGYGEFNFHNQYVQNFADLGIFGLLLLLAMLILSLKKGAKNKDFVHISFTVLMISLFLTESFLWRQRGVTFFTAMYCLFNSVVATKPLPKKNKSL